MRTISACCAPVHAGMRGGFWFHWRCAADARPRNRRPPFSGSPSVEKLVSLCKRKGFIFQSSGIYGGINGCWDFGPLGVELKRNLKNVFMYKFRTIIIISKRLYISDHNVLGIIILQNNSIFK